MALIARDQGFPQGIGGGLVRKYVKPIKSFYAVMDRERANMRHEFALVQGLMPLLMKPRNRQKWTREDRRELALHMKRMAQLSPYIAVIVLPGGFAMLPVLAWWLDRRRGRPARRFRLHHGASRGSAGERRRR